MTCSQPAAGQSSNGGGCLTGQPDLRKTHNESLSLLILKTPKFTDKKVSPDAKALFSVYFARSSRNRAFRYESGQYP